MSSFFSPCSVASRTVIVMLIALTIWAGESDAQTDNQARVDKAVQVVKDLCLAGQQYDLYIDVRGNIVIKSLKPGVEGYAAFGASEAKGATAISDQKLRIIADAEVRSCTREHLPLIINAILGQSIPSPQPPANIPPIDPEGLRATAAALAMAGEEGLRWSSSRGRDVDAANSLIEEYNLLVRRAILLFKTDPYIRSQEEVGKEKYPDVAASKVKKLAAELALYLTSFEANKALKQTAAALVKEGKEGSNWSASRGRDINAGKSLVWVHNYVLRRTKILFETNPRIQVFQDVSEERYPDIAARKVERSASELERTLGSL